MDGADEPEAVEPTVVAAAPPTEALVIDEAPAPATRAHSDETAAQGERAPEKNQEKDAVEDGSVDEPPPSPLACVRCGSTRMIPDQIVEDRKEGGAGELHTVVYANPNALIFKNARRGKLLADICGDCGHVELHVEKPGALYAHYRHHRRHGRPRL